LDIIYHYNAYCYEFPMPPMKHDPDRFREILQAFNDLSNYVKNCTLNWGQLKTQRRIEDVKSIKHNQKENNHGSSLFSVVLKSIYYYDNGY